MMSCLSIDARWWCSVKFRAWVQAATCDCIRNISGVYLGADLHRGYSSQWHLASWVIHSPLTLPKTQCCWSKHRPVIRDAQAGDRECEHIMEIHDSAHTPTQMPSPSPQLNSTRQLTIHKSRDVHVEDTHANTHPSP